MKILVAEDSLTNQMVIGRILEKLGFSVTFAVNGNEVLNFLTQSPYDLVLMDCQMPDLDGYGATKKIREGVGNQQSIPIIALTANEVEGDEKRCLESGMNGYLTKPVDRVALEAALTRFLGSKTSKVLKFIDVATLAQFDDLQMEGELDILVVTIETFLRTAPERLKALQARVEALDIEGAAKVAHAIKSGAATLGAKQLAQICLNIEMLKQSGKTTELKPLFAEFETLYASSKLELEGLASSRPKMWKGPV